MKSAMTIIKTAAVCCAVLLTVSCESTELRYIDKDERNLNESAEFTYTASDDVARRELGVFMDIAHESATAGIEDGAFAA